MLTTLIEALRPVLGSPGCPAVQDGQQGVDATTTRGALVFHIFGGLAQFERDLIREHSSAGLQAAEARGWKGGRRPVVTPDNQAAAGYAGYRLGKQSGFNPMGGGAGSLGFAVLLIVCIARFVQRHPLISALLLAVWFGHNWWYHHQRAFPASHFDLVHYRGFAGSTEDPGHPGFYLSIENAD